MSATSTLPPTAASDSPKQSGAAGRVAGRRWVALAGIVLLGLVVYLPSLRADFLLDDYLQASMIDGTYPTRRSPFNLYDFVDESEHQVLHDRGMLPWWSSPQLRIRFLRPLPSVLRWAEQQAFGRSPVPPHAHSFLWWVAAVLAAHRLFWRLLRPRPALLATAMFALAPCHALPLAWLANREALVSLVFGVLALTSYLAWRQEGGAGRAAAAMALFAVAMTGGEYALCMGGYVLAFELRSGRGAPVEGGASGRGLGRRALGLMLFLVPAAAYLGIRAALHYGTRGSSFYDDPLNDPLSFLRLVPRRLAALVAQEWLTLDADDSTSTLTLWALVIGGGALVAAPLRRTIAALDGPTRWATGALLLGSQLALVPVLAVDASPRLLGAALLGLVPALALVIEGAWFPAEPPAREGPAGRTELVALGIAFFQLVHGPATAFTIGRRYRSTAAAFVAGIADLHRRIPDPAHTELLVLRGGPSSFFVPFALAGYGELPSRWRVLSITGHVLGVRKGPRTLDLVAVNGRSMLSWFSWDLFRDTAADMRPGQVFEEPGLRATVIDVGTAGPHRVAFDLEQSLESPRYVWVTESDQETFPAATLPPQGYGQPYDP